MNSQSHHFILDARSSALRLTANLKAAQISQTIQLYSDSVQSIATRTQMQISLQDFNNGNRSKALLDVLQTDLEGALSGGGKNALFVQASILPRSNATPQDINGILNVTGDWVQGQIKLPYNYTNHTPVFLGDEGPGYPTQLYPNLTYIDGAKNVSGAVYENRTLYSSSILVLGPLYLNNSSALVSMTVAVNNNTSRSDILGWLTVVMDARLLYGVVASPEGLDNAGETLIIGPITDDNMFEQPVEGRSAASNSNVEVWYVLPPASNSTLGNRHNLRAFLGGNPDLPFKMSSYPAVLEAWSKDNKQLNNAGSYISTSNEERKRVSVGYAQISSPLVDWVLVFEQSYAEVIAPINRFRNIVLACMFSVMGAILLVTFPMAHYAVKPIRSLRSATEQSITLHQDEEFPPCSFDPDEKGGDAMTQSGHRNLLADGDTEGGLRIWKSNKPTNRILSVGSRQRMFRIPQRVPAGRHVLHDELTDLTATFNEMADELTVQYSRLEERVKLRTIELEQSRNAAQAANESKTLFVANISHELRTPLNGILGMCAIALHEQDTNRVRQALKIIYKSGDLLLHLLNDLLTFSRNSYGQQLAIEDEAFRLNDISTQLTSIFEKQAREAKIDLKVVFSGPLNEPPRFHGDVAQMLMSHSHLVPSDIHQSPSSVPAYGPDKTGLVREMSLSGDKNRILQILMNLVSNSLKFTPQGGAIEVRIRCCGYVSEGDMAPLKKMTTFSESSGTTLPGNSHHDGLLEAAEGGSNLLFQFEVEDTGQGIPEHLQQEIFKPFVQGDLALSKKFGGTGLGLAICSQLATLMHGNIGLKSTISIGSTFTVSLPLRYLKEQASSVSPSLIRPGSMIGSGLSVSKPGSLVARDEPGFPIPLPRDPSPERTSVYSGSSRAMDVPRIVGFSQPYLADSAQDDGPASPPKPSSQPSSSNHLKGPPNSSRPSSPAPRARLPAIPSGAQPTEAKTAPTANRIKVLIAEDNKVNQEVILRMLKLEKVNDVKVAQDGQEALDMVRDSMDTTADRFGLIFMDIQMPNLDGIESTKLIRRLGYSAPIVALTAFADESNKKACMEAGMNSFLPKPIKRTALKQVLKDFAEREPENSADFRTNES